MVANAFSVFFIFVASNPGLFQPWAGTGERLWRYKTCGVNVPYQYATLKALAMVANAFSVVFHFCCFLPRVVSTLGWNWRTPSALQDSWGQRPLPICNAESVGYRRQRFQRCFHFCCFLPRVVPTLGWNWRMPSALQGLRQYVYELYTKV